VAIVGRLRWGVDSRVPPTHNRIAPARRQPDKGCRAEFTNAEGVGVSDLGESPDGGVMHAEANVEVVEPFVLRLGQDLIAQDAQGGKGVDCRTFIVVGHRRFLLGRVSTSKKTSMTYLHKSGR
jgi:hypothetical protein